MIWTENFGPCAELSPTTLLTACTCRDATTKQGGAGFGLAIGPTCPSHAASVTLVTSMARILREPLLHFAVFAVLLFVVFEIRNDDEAPPPPSATFIAVSEADARALARQFEGVWNRPPAREELDTLISSYLDEEILVREALKLGLDRDDPVIRNRLRQKMLFLTESESQRMVPEDAVLEQHLQGNPERFVLPGQISFQQVYLGEAPDEETVRQSLDRLTEGQDPALIGVRSLLPAGMQAADPQQVDRLFGPGFFAATAQLPDATWAGPVRSGYGLHLVRIENRVAPLLPTLPDVREIVLADWRREQAQILADAYLAALRDTYDIAVPDAAALTDILTQ
ncbi:peptidyl-prolyl cis-trans isomerase [Fluviibacterium sp. DFM31]|uniref:Peptidyl-prolyl cis-trans isomerase n=1 Tax=Meridianimarinicoccus marinus TaxID=3231483 RepID=A0ABV3L4D8_9RHOB